MVPQIQFLANVLATGIGAYTDWKTGYIFDWITYPLMAVGLIISILTQQWLGIVLAVGIYAVGYFAYRSGKMGGGDVKLLMGMALVQPVYGGMIFVLGVLLLAAVSASIVLCLYYVGGFLLTQPKIHWNTPQKKRAGVMLLVSIIAFYILLTQNTLLSPIWMGIIGLALVLGVLFYAFEEEVKKHAFLKRIPLSELEEDEVLAVEQLTHEEKEKWGKNIPHLVGKEDMNALKHKGFTHIPVYRNLPQFAPFLFIGVLIVYLFPASVSQIVPSFL